MHGLNKDELKLFKKLNSPAKIQDFLERIPINFEKGRQTCYSPRQVLKFHRAHCMEGAMLAAAVLYFHGHKPLVVDLRAHKRDCDHAVAVFKIGGKWGAISKTNHAVLRYREPIYDSVRELIMSYFHEYFLDNGKKTLRSYTMPVDLSKFDKQNWITSENELWYIDKYLNKVHHIPILTKKQIAKLRPADPIEIRAGKLTVWPKSRGSRPAGLDQIPSR